MAWFGNRQAYWARRMQAAQDQPRNNIAAELVEEGTRDLAARQLQQQEEPPQELGSTIPTDLFAKRLARALCRWATPSAHTAATASTASETGRCQPRVRPSSSTRSSGCTSLLKVVRGRCRAHKQQASTESRSSPRSAMGAGRLAHQEGRNGCDAYVARSSSTVSLTICAA